MALSACWPNEGHINLCTADPEVTASFVPSGVYDKVLAIVAGAERETDEVSADAYHIAL